MRAPRPRFAAAGFLVLVLDLAIVMALYAVFSAPRAAVVANALPEDQSNHAQIIRIIVRRAVQDLRLGISCPWRNRGA